MPYRGVRKDGQVVWLEAHPIVIRNARGRPVGFQDVVRDVTETKALEDQLIAARDRGAAVLLISEDLDEIMGLSDVIHVMSQGRLSPGFARGTMTAAALVSRNWL